MIRSIFFLLLLVPGSLFSQSTYFFPESMQIDASIPSPQEFLGYPIGSHHTRHDRIVSYFETLADISPKASIEVLGETYEHRPLVMLTITSPENMSSLASIQEEQLKRVNPEEEYTAEDGQPVIINLGYGVHGNEASGGEAAMLTAYYLLADISPQTQKWLSESVILIDPVLNPDGRDRHTHWANMHKGSPMVADPLDREHNEVWPGGRTNHYWFDLNRDWFLLVHPESRAKMKWYHTWYPQVVTDFHEMGTGSTYFFEPAKVNGSLDPIIPEANYNELNPLFARYFKHDMDSIGSLYFTKEVYDNTYPGYGSSYPDLQGGLGLLFEQASSRGHMQRSDTWTVTFPYTIRNQLVSSLATVRASVENKKRLLSYQREFFTDAIAKARTSPIKGYVFGHRYNHTRNKAFLSLLLQHNIKVYPISERLRQDGKFFEPGQGYIVPTEQAQYKMVQSMFESYTEFRDSVFYDASAWSQIHAYGIPFAEIRSALPELPTPLIQEDLSPSVPLVPEASYAYLIDSRDDAAMHALYFLQQKGLTVQASQKPFTIANTSYAAGSLSIPLQIQSTSIDSVHFWVQQAVRKYAVEVESVQGGMSELGVDLGSRHFRTLQKPKVLMIVGEGLSGYESGELWHMGDTRLDLPITKVDWVDIRKVKLHEYNTLLMVSGRYNALTQDQQVAIQNWVSAGNTLITQRTATQWVIGQGWVDETLLSSADTSRKKVRKPYGQAPEILGATAIGGTIFEVDLDLTHPLAFGFTQSTIPFYKNNTVIMEVGKSPYNTVAAYTENPLISGYVSEKNLKRVAKAAAVQVSRIGGGRAILFADNPNFRGTWWGSQRMMLNAIFLGSTIRVY
ncbi:MAG: M14 metallopeptidase family protein [Bacteroidota bacterium]